MKVFLQRGILLDYVWGSLQDLDTKNTQHFTNGSVVSSKRVLHSASEIGEGPRLVGLYCLVATGFAGLWVHMANHSEDAIAQDRLNVVTYLVHCRLFHGKEGRVLGFTRDFGTLTSPKINVGYPLKDMSAVQWECK